MRRPSNLMTIVAAGTAFIALVTSACTPRVHLGAIDGDPGDGGGGGVGGGGGGRGGGDAGGTDILWSATFEPGNLSEWLDDGNGGTYLENTSVPITATTEFAHTGRYGGKTTVGPMMRMTVLAYLYRQQPSPREAYYSAWFYVPVGITVRSWLSLMHFRGSHTGDGRNVFPFWDINLYTLPSGGLAAQLYDHVTIVNTQQPSPLPVVPGQWLHLEVLLQKAADATGRIAVWQDNTPIFDLQGVATATNDWLEWDAGSASDDLGPTPSAIYVDDAAISLTRLGDRAIPQGTSSP